MKNIYTLFLTLTMMYGMQVHAQDVDISTPDKTKLEIQQLFAQDSIAKQEYLYMKSHPKVLNSKQIEDMTDNNQLENYQSFIIIYDAKRIEFNSLFVKTLIENDQIAYMDLSPTKAIIWAEQSLDKDALIFNLNKISMTPVTEFIQLTDDKN
ncbi:MAG: hypothetical protein M9887_01185 [Chitinophagales bacterium]|nr:hypothetical protein [Chitinophagales bacterium]